MTEGREVPGGEKLHRVLGTWDLVLMNVAAIVGLSWLSTAAQIGPSSLVLWLLGMACFLVPVALAVLELSSRMPGEGGLYLWSKSAFGDLHGFVVGWTYWVVNLVFFPFLLLFGAGVLVYVGGNRWLSLADSAVYNGAYCLAALWGATLLNVFGLERARWLQNVGAAATWSAVALLLAGGAIAWHRFGSATVITASTVMPDFGSFATLTTLVMIALAYAGIEVGPILGDEIRDPRRMVPRALLISVVLVVAIYTAGTAALLVTLPTEQIDLIGGTAQALAAIGARLEIPTFGPVTAALITLGNLGGLGAWVAGTARLPFVMGVDRYLPRPLASLHPKHGTPWVALLTQGTVTSLVLLAALSGSTIHEAFVVLINLSATLALLPLLYIFLALPVMRHRAKVNNDGITMIPGGPLGLWLTSVVGTSVTLFAIATSMMPPADSSDPGLFLIKVVGGNVLLIGVGLGFYARGRRRHSRRAS